MLLLKTSDNIEDILDVSAENLKQLQEEAGMVREDTLMRFIRIFSELSNQLKYASSKRILLEIALIKLCKPEMEEDELSLVERIRELEKKVEQGVAVQPADPPIRLQEEQSEEEEKSKTKELAEAAPRDLQEVKKLWHSIVAETEGRFKIILSGAHIRFNTQGSDGRLYVVFPDFQGERYINNEERIRELKNIIEGKIGKQIELKMMLEADTNISKTKLASIHVDEVIKQFVHTDIEIEDEGGL